ncbi:hypothetical protein EV651_115100 [Kribbella sp. VKM Ac-2571]|uniref:hypothetical protein n=1 Tax=Kribbella sp. VKM Ac-2571 TaxID=2512222 RepID=UPI00105F0793|nr:hypothetical protein [Kribbella sp. VKM Ac-2571]TDO55136.1 hypothetical protein EV651_115100 [Kribbella sp. VKM Ac-2571]
MSTSDNVFVAAGDPVAAVAEWLADVLELEPVADADPKDDERVFRRTARTETGTVAVRVRPNGFAVVDPQEPDEIQAIDRYPIDLSIWLVGRKDEEGQLRETTAIFVDLVTARPDVPALLVHNLDTLVSAHLPGAGTHTFDPPITPDIEDIDTWRDWTVS